MRIEGSKLVVIGGAGLIGSHTVDELLNEDVSEIVVFDNFERGSLENLEVALADPRVMIVDGDVGDLAALSKTFKGADGVFHFAAMSLLHCYEHPRNGFDVNLAGTFNVLEACRESAVRRLVFSSSASVYGDALEDPMTESHPFNNTTFYGATKIGGEAMVQAFCHRSGLGYVGLRYFNVYGTRQDYEGAYVAVIMKILDRLDRGEAPTVYGDGSQAYDFINVRDCARVNVEVIKAEVVDRFYNVCTGIGTSIRELAETLIDLTGQEVEIDYLPEEISFVSKRIGDPTSAREGLGFV
ncbi:MAG: NAD-dependent epimerase/dehydratase family protein, partial [Gemmatimonadetes bacterium]|nr:NAD-dependent epimerase/dehydratase family protein [Gemmatimonadota bacterium]